MIVIFVSDVNALTYTDTHIHEVYDKYETISNMFGAESAGRDRRICKTLFHDFDNLVTQMEQTNRKYNTQTTEAASPDHTGSAAHAATAASRRVLMKQIQDQEKEMQQYHERLDRCKRFVKSIIQQVKKRGHHRRNVYHTNY